MIIEYSMLKKIVYILYKGVALPFLCIFQLINGHIIWEMKYRLMETDTCHI